MPSENWGKTGISADVLNAIRNQASDHYKDYVPIMQPGTNDVFTVGNVILDHVDIRNEFLNVLPNVIKEDAYFQYDFVNPFEKYYYRGFAEEADVIQHIFVQGPDTVPYDIADSESFTQHYDPKVKTAYWYQRVNYQQNWSISYDELKMAFKNSAMMDNFLENLRRKSEYQKKVNDYYIMIYISYLLDKMQYIGSFYGNSFTALFENIFSYFNTNNDAIYSNITTNNFIIIADNKILQVNHLENYHIENVHTFTDYRIHIIPITTAGYARFFNTKIIENYNARVTSNPNIMLMCDRNTFNYYDTLDTTKVFDNPQTLTYNFTRNIRQIYGISPYATTFKGVIQSSRSKEGE